MQKMPQEYSISTENNVVPPILSSSYQSWVVPAPVLLSMGGCCRVTPTAWGLDGGLWWLAGLRLGWMGARVGPDGIRMGARGRLGLPPDSGGTVRPNTTRASKVPNNHKPTPRILSPLKPLTLVTTSLVCFLFSCRSSSIPTFGTAGQTDWVIHRLVHSERSTRQCAAAHIWSDILQLACVQPPTSIQIQPIRLSSMSQGAYLATTLVIMAKMVIMIKMVIMVEMVIIGVVVVMVVMVIIRQTHWHLNLKFPGVIRRQVAKRVPRSPWESHISYGGTHRLS